MEIYIDSADIDAIRELAESGIIAGVTTNPSLIVKSGNNIVRAISEICQIISGPVSAEVISEGFEDMLKEATTLAGIAKNVVVKLPITFNGLKVCKILKEENIAVNMTLCFSAAQALVAARVGADYVSPYLGRLDDIGENGIDNLRDICDIYKNYQDINTKIIAASIRNVRHVELAAQVGVDIATMAPNIIKQLWQHRLTDKGLELFAKDWQESKCGGIF